jgi:hypothetical protein
MKAIDIATKNHITIEDMMEVCKDLEISCEGEASEMSEKDIFLIEKKIEAIKKRKIQKLEQSREGKKIKLKRKVHVSKEIKDKATGETPAPEEEKAKTATAESGRQGRLEPLKGRRTPSAATGR